MHIKKSRYRQKRRVFRKYQKSSKARQNKRLKYYKGRGFFNGFGQLKKGFQNFFGHMGEGIKAAARLEQKQGPV